MASKLHPHDSFELELRLEAERVLTDVLFERAPIQSRLLRYLVTRAAKGGEPPSQYEIAVDGLGKDPDYDVESDSYPRVQMSRLRRTLDSYYLRNQPGNGMRLFAEVGSYKLGLKPTEKSLGTAKSPAAPSEPEGDEDAATGSERKPTSSLLWIALGILGLIAATLILVLFMEWHPAQQPSSAAVSNKPTTRLIIENNFALPDGAPQMPAIASVSRVARIQLANSFVSKPLPLDRVDETADYFVTFNFGRETSDGGSVFLSLADDDGDILYSKNIDYDPNDLESLDTRIEAVLVYVTSPVGTIAVAERPAAGDETLSDYMCFLAIESGRSNGADTADLIDRCLDTYPESEYVPFWYARRAFARYQADIVAGRPILKSGAAWRDLRSAFERDRFNAFANFVGAKVELANGNCADALEFVDQALERGGSYPALVVSMEVNAASCPRSEADGEAMAERLRLLAADNPAPDPLLHLYLVIGLLSAGDQATAKLVADRTMIDLPEGPVEETSDLLRRALADPRFARMNRERIGNAVYLFVWNEDTAGRVVDALVD